MAWSSVCCSAVPSYVLENVARRGSETQRTRARETMRLGRAFRSMRHLDAGTRRPFYVHPRVRWLNFLRSRWAAERECETERRIHDAQNMERLPGRLVRGEGAPATGDAAVDEAYDGFGVTLDLLWEEFNRCSLDDQGMPLIGTVHYGRSFDNAFFDGRQMVFGDGDERDEHVPEDEKLFNRFTIAIDVIGHELAHGLVDRTVGLVYIGQPGALNEHVADVFGSMVKQKKLGQEAQDADWLIGEGLFTANVQSGTPGQPAALRSMKDPGTAYDDPVFGKDPQPGHMSEFVRGPADNWGVHINSGIPNKAFYLAATSIGGHSWEAVGRIWYETLLSPTLPPFANFQQFARETIIAASDLFGPNSTERQAIIEAWDEVGVTVAGARLVA